MDGPGALNTPEMRALFTTSGGREGFSKLLHISEQVMRLTPEQVKGTGGDEAAESSRVVFEAMSLSECVELIAVTTMLSSTGRVLANMARELVLQRYEGGERDAAIEPDHVTAIEEALEHKRIARQLRSTLLEAIEGLAPKGVM